MKAITTVFLAAALALFVSANAGCGDKKESKDSKAQKTAAAKGSELLVEYTSIVDEICACTDADCVKGLRGKLVAFRKKAGKKPPDELRGKVRELQKRMLGCMRKVGGPGKMRRGPAGGGPAGGGPAGGGVTPPPTESGTPTKVEPATK